MNEAELIAGCIKNDRRCQSELYKRYFGMMSSVALRYYRSEDDALHAINYGFLKVLQNMEKYNEKYSLATWIRNILVHHFIDEFRKKNSRMSEVDLPVNEVSEKLTSTNLAEYHFSEMELRSMLNALPNVTGTVFNLYAIEGYKHTEIADLLKISEGTSKWHVSEARKRLKMMLEENRRVEKKMIRTSYE